MPSLATHPRILDRFKADARTHGLVGEEDTAAVLYLVVTSRLLDRQASAGVKGHSSSGKSYTVDTTLDFFPDEAVLEFTAMSERALVYSDRDYRHRTMVIYEVVALREGQEDDMTSYLVRSLLSEGRINYEVTVRGSDGAWTTKTITKEGPTNLIFTTTATTVHAENETRVLSLDTNDTREQTRRVLAELASESAAGVDLTDWHDLQRWLEKGPRKVTVPYGSRLAELVPPVAIRLRRDFGALLALIRAHALLHRASRESDDTGQIVATLKDYEVVRDLVGPVLAAGVEATVPPTVRQTVEAVAELTEDTDTGVMARVVAEHLQLDKSNASRRLRRAADRGYLRNLEDRRGKPARWIPGDPLPEDVQLLPEPEALADGCAVAPDSEGGSDPDGCAVAPDSEGGSDPDGCAVAPDSEGGSDPTCDRCDRPAVRLIPARHGDGHDPDPDQLCSECCAEVAG